MRKRSCILKDFEDSGAMNTFVNIHAAVDDCTFVTKGGDLLMVIAVHGADDTCFDAHQIDYRTRRFEAAMRTFDNRFRTHQYVIKRDHALLPSGSYDDPVVSAAIKSRMGYLEAKAGDLYSMETYFAVVFEESRQKERLPHGLARFIARPKDTLAEMLSTEKNIDGLNRDLERRRAELETKVQSFIIQMQDVVDLHVLDKERAFRFFRRLLNYTPHVADAGRLKYDSFVDFQACSSALECYRDHLRMEDYFIQVLTIKEPPGKTFAHLLRSLEEVPGNYVIASEWKRLPNDRARQMIQSMRRHYHNSKHSLMNYVGSSSATDTKDRLIDDSAASVVMELGACLQDIEINGRSIGEFSITLVLFDKDRAALQRHVAECFKVFAVHDGQLIQERYNLLNSWFGVLPGNSVYNLRRVWLLSANFADLSFLFTPQVGEHRSRHLNAEYLAVFETDVGAPFFFNLHYQDVGHTFILGATGSGKSVLLNFLVMHTQKYQPFTFIFDLGGSYDVLTRLFGGSYVSVGNAERPLRINPFCLPPTQENLQFLYSFFRVLVETSGYQMSAKDERDLFEAIKNVYEVAPDQRRLFTLANIVNTHLRGTFQKWAEGGQYGHWFDHADDNLTFARFQTFDFEGMKKMPQVLEPFLFYVLHRANAVIYDPNLATTPKIFVMDEAWRFFQHPTTKLYIQEACKTWRKHNGAMILSTQSCEDLVGTDMLSVVVESCPTQMFLANPGMDQKVYRELFHLNQTEAERIANLIPKREILIKRPDFSKVVSLNLDPIGYWLYTNNPNDKEKRREAFDRYGVEQGLDILARSNPTCN